MSKEFWKAGNMLYPLPAVMVSCKKENEIPNIITIAWTGTVCTNPPMVYISVRKERHSYDIIKESGEFVINIGSESTAEAVDYCGVKSGRQVDKFKEMNLTAIDGNVVKAPLIKESPVNIECRVKQIIELGSHDMFLADVVGVHVDKQFINEKGKFELGKAAPIVYSHGEYYGLNEVLGTFGYSVRRMNGYEDKNGIVSNKGKSKALDLAKGKDKSPSKEQNSSKEIGQRINKSQNKVRLNSKNKSKNRSNNN